MRRKDRPNDAGRNAPYWLDGECWGENCDSDGIEAREAFDNYDPENDGRELGMLAFAGVQSVPGSVVVEAMLIPTAYDGTAVEAYL